MILRMVLDLVIDGLTTGMLDLKTSSHDLTATVSVCTTLTATGGYELQLTFSFSHCPVPTACNTAYELGLSDSENNTIR